MEATTPTSVPTASLLAVMTLLLLLLCQCLLHRCLFRRHILLRWRLLLCSLLLIRYYCKYQYIIILFNNHKVNRIGIRIRWHLIGRILIRCILIQYKHNQYNPQIQCNCIQRSVVKVIIFLLKWENVVGHGIQKNVELYKKRKIWSSFN